MHHCRFILNSSLWASNSFQIVWILIDVGIKNLNDHKIIVIQVWNDIGHFVNHFVWSLEWKFEVKKNCLWGDLNSRSKGYQPDALTRWATFSWRHKILTCLQNFRRLLRAKFRIRVWQYKNICKPIFCYWIWA